MKIN
jgi:hypothetical protein